MRINKGKIDGTVSIPSSKSFLHRQLILASIFGSGVDIVADNYGEDINRTIDCLTKLGANISRTDTGLNVDRCNHFNTGVTINVGESGSTLRFLLPIVASLGLEVTFEGSEGIIKRPIYPIIDLIKASGVMVSSDTLPLRINGKLTNNDLTIDGSLSSQFATGLLISLAIIGKGKLTITNAVSVDYLSITAECLRQFNIQVLEQKEDNKITYFVDAKNIVSPKTINVEGDWSSASFILALGALYGKTTVKNLNINSCQGDKVIVDLLKKMGGKITIKDDEITAEKSTLNKVDVSVKNCPDLAPILSVILLNAKGESTITDTDRLTIKESNRLDNIVSMLTRLNIKVTKGINKITITGGKVRGANLLSHNDHRIAISSIVALTGCGGTVDDIKCIDKSYPSFLIDYLKIGGEYEL